MTTTLTTALTPSQLPDYVSTSFFPVRDRYPVWFDLDTSDGWEYTGLRGPDGYTRARAVDLNTGETVYVDLVEGNIEVWVENDLYLIPVSRFVTAL